MRRAAVLALALLASAAAAPARAAVPQPRAPTATVVMVPGSGFNGARAANAARMSFKIASWRTWGFRTKVAPYRAGKAGYLDVLRAVRSARRSAPALPVCVYGESSGATFALLLAARTPGVDCVIALAAPTDQETLARASARRARHLGATMWPRRFGPADADDAWEPYDVWGARAVAVPTLLAYSAGDDVVPPQQGELLATVAPQAELRLLRSGRHRFVHAPVDPADFVRTRRAARALVEAQTTSP